MEAWLLYTLITYFLWTLTGFVDKIFLNKIFNKPLIYNTFVGLFQILVIILIPFVGFTMPQFYIVIFGLALGILFFLCLIPYFKAISSDDVSLVAPLFSLTPILVLILSAIFLKDFLGSKEIVAFFLFLIGGFLISVKEFKNFRITKALKYVLLSCFMFSIYLLLMKYFFDNVGFFEGFILLRIGHVMGAGLMLLNKNVRTSLKKQFFKLNLTNGAVFTSNELLSIISQFFFNLAVSLGPIALINACSGVQYAMLFILVLIFTLFFPRILKEDLSKAILIRKILAILIISGAVYLLSI